jgi:Mg-chelatase subunit ChlD
LTTAQVASLSIFRAERRLHTLLQAYEGLEPAFAAAHRAIDARATHTEIDSWCTSIVSLLELNLGLGTLRAFLTLSQSWPPDRPLAELNTVGRSLHRIGREAGSAATQALLDALPASLHKISGSSDLRRMLDVFTQLAEQAPESVMLVAARLPRILDGLNVSGFEIWLTAGLRAHGGSTRKRREYFAIDDPLSSSSTIDEFSGVERRLAMGIAALWDQRPLLRPTTARRASLIGGVVRLPDHFLGMTGDASDRMYWAATAHAGAHLAFSGPPFPVGKLKPLQIVLVSLIEDARVEQLAMRTMPGLARLWRPYHVAEASGQSAAAQLLARLSRALIDPTYRDDHGWIEKGRTLFEAAMPDWHTPDISRRIGGLLGNDIGQMRLQFNPRTHIVEPAYRDDNMGLWDFGDQPGELAEEIEIGAESVRLEQRERDDGKPNDRIDEASPRARPRQTAATEGILVARYPEWDYALGRLRPNWVTVRETEPNIATLPPEPMPLGSEMIARRMTAIARGAAIGRRIREKRQNEGEILDLDACIAAAVARRGGLPPDERVFQREKPGPRDLALLLMLDMSQSTNDKGRDGRSLLAVEKDAASILGAAFEAAGDALAIHAFNSDGRDKVRYVQFKSFSDPMDSIVRRRLSAMISEHSTRLGAALRHAGNHLKQQRAFRHVVVMLTDGEPSDIDVQDSAYLVEDARHAAQTLRRSGADVLAFGLGQGSFQALDRIVGAKFAFRVPRIETLPERMIQLYARLKT